MEKYYSKDGLPIQLADVRVRYGKEQQVQDTWKDIVREKDETKRNQMVDKLIAVLVENAQENGFIGPKEVVETGRGNGFYLDDYQLYYMFFHHLKTLVEANVDNKMVDGALIHHAIKTTCVEYNGGIGSDKALRSQLTAFVMNDQDEYILPSIKEQKGKNTFHCTEYAAITHNLWLMTGKTSYFCFSLNSHFETVGEQYQHDSHNFTIVEYDGKFRLYDLALRNFCMLEKDCIEDLVSGKGLQVMGVTTPGIYAPNQLEKTTEDASACKR